MSEYLLTPAHERRMQAILSDIAPGGGSGDEQYALPADVELVFIMAGRLEITIDEERVLLEEGDSFTFTASARHAFRAVDESGPTRVLWVVSPALPDTTRYP
jgi:quercetin dioxygenase-like cupin family protein